MTGAGPGGPAESFDRIGRPISRARRSGANAADVSTIILALDTATEICSVALAVDEQVVERQEAVGQKHSERVLPMVHDLLRERGLRLAECSAVAFGAGPGAFTGLRIACSVAQGLAFGAGLPVVAVGNLEALAQATKQAHPAPRTILTAIDARMQEIYWALYAHVDDRWIERAAPALASAAQLPALCAQFGPDLVAGSALRAFPGVAAQLDCATASEAVAGAGAIAVRAVDRFRAGAAVPPALAAPLYVRDRVALTIDERQAVAKA